jgi:dolichol-phosphate mannosyltransferase
MVAIKDEDRVFSVILPTLNEGDNIVPMIETISNLYPSSKVIVMDDNSIDGTREKVLDRYPNSDRVKVIRRNPKDSGLTASIIEGILNVDTKYFVVMDADFQHPPQSLGDMIDSLNEGNDLVIGVREDKMSMMFYRQIASWGAHVMASTYLACKRRPRSRDTMSGFFGGDTALCQKIIRENGHKFERKGFKALFDILKFAPRDLKIGEVVFKFNTRRSGESKLSSKIVLSIMRQCGLPGKALAAAVTFFLLSSFGRLLAAILLGIVSTMVAILFTGEVSNKVFMNMLLCLFSATLFMVLTNEFIAELKWRGVISRGIVIVGVAFLGYLINLFMSYVLNDALLAVALIPSMLGITVAFSYDIIGTHLRRPSKRATAEP